MALDYLSKIPWFRQAEIVPPDDIEAASLRSDRFRLEREVDWQRLERIVPPRSKRAARSASPMTTCSICRCSIARPPPALQ